MAKMYISTTAFSGLGVNISILPARGMYVGSLATQEDRRQLGIGEFRRIYRIQRTLFPVYTRVYIYSCLVYQGTPRRLMHHVGDLILPNPLPDVERTIADFNITTPKHHTASPRCSPEDIIRLISGSAEPFLFQGCASTYFEAGLLSEFCLLISRTVIIEHHGKVRGRENTIGTNSGRAEGLIRRGS